MKKVLIGSLMAFAAFVVVSPSGASAQSAAQEHDRSQRSKAAIEKCEKRLTGIRSTADTMAKYRNASYVRPGDMSAYPAKDLRVLGGSKQKVHVSKANSGPHKGYINFVVANDRYKGAAAVAGKSVYKSGPNKGKPAYDVSGLNAKASQLDNQISSWNTLLNAMSDGFKEGAKYNKGQNYGWTGANSDKDKNLKSPRTFSVSLSAEQCKSSEGRSNVSFLNKRRAIMIRAAKQGIKETRKISGEASAEYKKMNQHRKNMRNASKQNNSNDGVIVVGPAI
jgi:hypothetical protein